MLLAVLEDALFAGLAAAAFAILFNVPRRTLGPCIVTGAVGHALRYALVHAMGLGLVPATLVAAIVIGAFAQLFGRLLRVPWTVFAITGAIPVVPGALAFQTMIGALRVAGATAGTADLDGTLTVALRTGLVLGAIGVGIGLPTLIARRAKETDLAS
ncbi:MAG: threonine/serine exporter family protein [Deltaproteobacteria bacterium]|nr:threonine/serine exporter family protein [Deltaproteobacteria bacterium]